MSRLGAARVNGLLAGLRLVLQRARHDWLVVGAAAVITLLAAAFLAGGLIYADAVASAGLQRSLASAEAQSAGLQVRVGGPPDLLARTDEAVRDEAALLFANESPTVQRRGDTGSWTLPGQDADDITQLTVFAYLDDLAAHATLVDGAWPTGAGEDVEVALNAEAAAGLGYAVGDELDLVSRLDPEATTTARLVGTWLPAEISDRYWWGERLDLEGVDVGQTYTTWGPMVVDESRYDEVATAGGSAVSWRVFPDPARVTAARLSAIAADLEGLQARLRSRVASSQLNVVSDLGEKLAAADRSLVVAQMSVTVLAIQLAVLAGYALVLTAGLLIEQRRGETALLRARGAGAWQLGLAALIEALVLAVPVAIVAPLLATWALGAFNAAGPLHEIGLSITPRVTALSQAVAAATAAACALALAMPSLLQGRSFVALRARRGRQASSGMVERAGLDVALLVIAGVGIWQLRAFGAPLTGAVRGQLGVDPLLVAAPAIGLLAGAVIALRILPLVARLADAGMTHGRGLVASLGAWQIARRPLRYAPAALLLIVTMALGIFAISYGRTWAVSQADQAAYQVGADLRVVPNRFAGAVPSLDLASAYRAAGASDVMAAHREGVTFGGRSGGQVLLLDARRGDEVVAFRGDLANDPFAAMMARLADARPELDVPRLPDGAEAVAVTALLAVDDPPPFDPQEVPQNQRPGPVSPFSLALVVVDGDGIFHRVELGEMAPGATPSRLVAPLVTASVAGGAPTGPLSLVAIELHGTAGDNRAVGGHLDIVGLEASVAGTWQAWAPAPAGGFEAAAYESSGQLTLEAGLEEAPDGVTDRLGFLIGAALDRRRLAPVTWSLRPAGVAAGRVTPKILVNGSLLGATEAGLGDDATADLGYGIVPLRLEEDLDAFPTLDPGEAIIVGDLGTVALDAYLARATVLEPDEWWMTAAEPVALGDALRAPPFESVETIASVTRTAALQTDPVALGILGALLLGVVAAAAFAAIGFAVSTSVAARERMTEFAVLRALGLSPRQLAGWLSLENAILVVVSLLIGTGLGLLISWVVLPFVTLTQAGTRPVPDLQISIPWGQIALLEAVALVSLTVTVGVLAFVLRRVGLGSALRIGED
ncbi:MAG: ABC transporter permease [Chloroflexota bacterium]